MRVLLIVALCGLMHAAQSFTATGGPGASAGRVTLALGFVLLSAYLLGGLLKSLRLPRLTGYLAAGMLAGPYALGWIRESALEDLRVFNGVAVSLIALTAGAELHLPSIRPLARMIAWTTGIAVCGTTLLIGAAVFLGAGWLQLDLGETLPQRGSIALLLGITLVAQSPAVVVALHKETAAEGPLTNVVLGVVVLADLLVIFLFTVTSALATALHGGSADAWSVARTLGWELLGSAAVGLVLGGVLSLYLRKVPGGIALFILALTFVIAEVGLRLHLDPLIIALTVGLFVRNVSEGGERLHHGIEGGSLPIYVVFFAVAGAGIHLDVLTVVGLPAAALVLVRGVGLWTGTRLAARLADAPEVVRRYAGFGLLPQAGLALALALLFQRHFPDLGPQAAGLILSVVAINEILAPVIYRVALLRSGEAGRAVAEDGDEDAQVRTEVANARLEAG
jgi:Kef-type K+ transport system membrane component KefB